MHSIGPNIPACEDSDRKEQIQATGALSCQHRSPSAVYENRMIYSVKSSTNIKKSQYCNLPLITGTNTSMGRGLVIVSAELNLQNPYQVGR